MPTSRQIGSAAREGDVVEGLAVFAGDAGGGGPVELISPRVEIKKASSGVRPCESDISSSVLLPAKERHSILPEAANSIHPHFTIRAWIRSSSPPAKSYTMSRWS